MIERARVDSGRILVIDDNPRNVLLIRGQLERVGYVVNSAETGREGLDAAIAEPPDLILLDIMMPGLNGFQVCQSLRANESTIKTERALRMNEERFRKELDDLAFDGRERSVDVVVGELVPCQGDAILLKQLFVNLLSNAFKFTRQRAVGAQIDGEVVYFVKDDGAGFDMQYADKLFGVFRRLDRAEDFEGTGVGLAIVQRHGGRVWADSALDHGATFSFTLANAQTAGAQ